MPKIIKQQRLADDEWKVLQLAENETAHSVRLPLGPLLVPLAVWRARKEELIHRNWEHHEPLGVWLAPNEGPETIAEELDDFTLIAVHFPKLGDGRGYSTARLLRERYGYRGELRAFGDVGQDQLFFLNRVGFDSFSVKEDLDDVEALAAAVASLATFPEAYQAAANQPLPLFQRRAV
jgi:uncharacterized protein (DUF934 family)